jgi:hypothetical protein
VCHLHTELSSDSLQTKEIILTLRKSSGTLDRKMDTGLIIKIWILGPDLEVITSH